jgi:tetratricopeptide (TPR) repeat protein
MRGHERRREPNWVADLLKDAGSVLDLLREPRIAHQSLPLVLRTLFWNDDYELALKAIGLCATESTDAETRTVVDAALSDLIGRLEQREDARGSEPLIQILQRVMQLPTFTKLTPDVRVRYHATLARAMLRVNEFELARSQSVIARELALSQSRMFGQAIALGMLAELRLHDVLQIQPRKDRPERDAAIRWLADVPPEQWHVMPIAAFLRGVLAYELGEFHEAEACFASTKEGLRRTAARDQELLHRADFFLAASILAGGNRDEHARAQLLMEDALEHVRSDLETFYPVHEALKTLDRRLALRFLDSVEIGRGTSPDQLLIVALEYLALGEAEPASKAAERVLQIAVDLDQRIEAMRVMLTARNMQGRRDDARTIYDSIRDLLLQRGAFYELEKLLQNETFVGQALDHLEIKCELVALYEEMEEREVEKAQLQTQIARSLRARKDEESLQQAHGILSEVGIRFPDMARDELHAIEKLLELYEAPPVTTGENPGTHAQKALGRKPRLLVVGGNERQRRHHTRFEELAKAWGLDAEWLMANYTSPQKVVSAIDERLARGLDVLLLLHWNRHETTEPALAAARKAGVLARTVHYAGFTSLQVALADLLGKLQARKAGASR